MALYLLVPLILCGCHDVPQELRTKEYHGIPFHEVPSGKYAIGSRDGEGQEDEHPQFFVELHSIWMMETEITNQQFSDFLNNEGITYDIMTSLVAIKNEGSRPSEIHFTGKRYRPSFGYEDHPVVSLSYRGAEAFCESIGARLPTEVEWESSARGGLSNAQYPWGDEDPSSRASFGMEWRSSEAPAPTLPVASFQPNGYGLYDMAGSAWEWTQTLYHNYLDQMPLSDTRVRAIVRGGSWGSPKEELRVAFRRNYELMTRSNFFGGLGGRCVVDEAVNP